MGFEVSTMRFEGPLDLLLHLIHENELDIFDLDMSVLTDQYIEYLHQMEKLDIEVESEYLVELSRLIELKSLKMLPKPETDEDDYEEDPRDRLVKRLLEYQKYKEVTKALYDAFTERQFQLSKPISVDEIKNTGLSDDVKIEGDPYELLKAMNKVLRRLQLQKPLETKFARKELSAEDRVLQIKARLKSLPDTFNFDTLIDDCKEVREVVVTFLAILDMAKNHYLVFKVDENETIWFKRGTNND